ncbi:MAG: carbohydrate-binding domain-containing protein [Oscillospiraceae bacterium]|nr:carbohydrate-binding domain-containing protein [Oscillospiraceae bacterium]
MEFNNNYGVINRRRHAIAAVMITAALLCAATFPAASGFAFAQADETAVESIDYTELLYAFTAEDEDASIPDDATRIDMTASGVKITGVGAAADAATILIQLPGTYVLTGESNGRQVLIDAKKTDVVRLVLDGAAIVNDGAAAIYARKAARVAIILADGTSNTVKGGVADAADSEDDDLKSAQSAVYIKNDLVITGGGALTVEGPGHGVWAKDMLIMTGGTMDVTIGGFALRGSDGVAMKGVTASITSGGDGIKSTKADDPAKGFIQLEDCVLNIAAYNDGVQAESALVITGGEYAIHAGGGADAVELSSGKSGHNNRFGGFVQAAEETEGDGESMKGLKAGTMISVWVGVFALDTQDDAVHSDGDICIDGGKFSIRTGDDGVHAEGLLEINGGNITIERCFEGLEGSEIEINGGEYSIQSADDSINLSDGSASRGGWGMGRGGSAVASMTLSINGGVIRATGGTDTIDANGNVVMYGGELYLNGQSQGMEGAIDFDGTFTVYGGRLITAGSVLSVAAESTQPVLLVRFGQAVEAGSVIELRSEAGDVILAIESEIACSASGFSSPDMSPDETVSVWVDGVKRFDAMLSKDAAVSSASEDGGAYGLQNGRMGGGFGGGRLGGGGFNPGQIAEPTATAAP